MHLLNHVPPHLFWALAVTFVVFPAAVLLWTALRAETSHPAPSAPPTLRTLRKTLVSRRFQGSGVGLGRSSAGGV